MPRIDQSCQRSESGCFLPANSAAAPLCLTECWTHFSMLKFSSIKGHTPLRVILEMLFYPYYGAAYAVIIKVERNQKGTISKEQMAPEP